MGRPGIKRKDSQVLTPAEIKSKKLKEKKNKVMDEGSIGQRMGELEGDVKIKSLTEDGFIKDLLWVYSEWGGRNQLLKEVQNDAQVRREFVQLLLRMEFKKTEMREKKAAQGKLTVPVARGKVMHSQASNQGDGGSNKRSFLFLMKGLDSKDEAVKAKSLDDQISPHNEDSKTEKEYEYTLQGEDEEIIMDGGDE